MRGHRADAQHVAELDHVGTTHDVGKSGALPKIAAVKEERVLGPRLGAQTIGESLDVSEAAERAIPVRRFLEIETGEGIGAAVVLWDRKMLEECIANEMRRLSSDAAEADIGARLTEIDRPDLRVRVGLMQDARVAPFADRVDVLACLSAADTRNSPADCCRDKQLQSLAAARGHRHAVSAVRSCATPSSVRVPA